MDKNEIIFNDEFLKKGSDDFERAQEMFPEFMFALHNSDIFDVFHSRDRKALDEKRRMLLGGLATILLGLSALILAAFEMAIIAPQIELIYQCQECDRYGWTKDWNKEAIITMSKMIAMFAGILGIASFITGYFFGGTGRRKRNWLRQRATCESFRQWRWRYFLATNDKIIDAVDNEEAQKSYIENWTAASASFFRDVDSEIGILLDQIFAGNADASVLEELLHVPSSSKSTEPEIKSREQIRGKLAHAYDCIRVRSQIRYAH